MLNVPIPETGISPRSSCEMWLEEGGRNAAAYPVK